MRTEPTVCRAASNKLLRYSRGPPLPSLSYIPGTGDDVVGKLHQLQVHNDDRCDTIYEFVCRKQSSMRTLWAGCCMPQPPAAFIPVPPTYPSGTKSVVPTAVYMCPYSGIYVFAIGDYVHWHGLCFSCYRCIRGVLQLLLLCSSSRYCCVPVRHVT